MSSQTPFADQAVHSRHQRKSRRSAKSVALSVLAGAMLSLGYLSSLQAGISGQADAEKQRLAPGHRSAAESHARASGLEALGRLQSQGSAPTAFPTAAILSFDFLPPSKVELPGQSEAVNAAIAPVARVQIPGSDSPAAKPAASDAGAASAQSQAQSSPAMAQAGASAEAAALTLVEHWAHAWSERDVDQYLGAYGKGFTPDKGLSRSAWEQSRRQKIESRKSIAVSIRDLKVDADGENRLTVSFVQDYTADSFRETGTPKSLVLTQEDGAWRIVAEKSGNSPAK